MDGCKEALIKADFCRPFWYDAVPYSQAERKSKSLAALFQEGEFRVERLHQAIHELRPRFTRQSLTRPGGKKAFNQWFRKFATWFLQCARQEGKEPGIQEALIAEDFCPCFVRQEFS